jgi:uncharacterized membrane protein/predicted DsbA family dithiol-disulfide isomerase
MTATGRIRIIRVLALIALTLSAALLVNHIRPNPSLCGFESNCQDVLQSSFARPMGVPLPLLGLVLFAVVLGASLWPDGRAGRLQRPLTLAAGGGGLTLLLLQLLVLQRLCRLCAVVDVAAVGMAVVELTMWQKAPAAPDSRLRPLWLVAAVAGLGFGTLLAVAGAPRSEETLPPPPEVTALWAPGKVNVVEVADFACPHCRRMHAVLTRFLAEEGDRVHFVRLTAPMPAHTDARHASRAFLCARAQGKGDEMAEALFLAPMLDAESCERVAASLQLSLPAFRACSAAPETEERLDTNLAWVRKASPHGLPVIWVQERMFFGLQSIEALRMAARDAQRQRDG